jgi:hypothetical protein
MSVSDIISGKSKPQSVWFIKKIASFEWIRNLDRLGSDFFENNAFFYLGK